MERVRLTLRETASSLFPSGQLGVVGLRRLDGRTLKGLLYDPGQIGARERALEYLGEFAESNGYTIVNEATAAQIGYVKDFLDACGDVTAHFLSRPDLAHGRM